MRRKKKIRRTRGNDEDPMFKVKVKLTYEANPVVVIHNIRFLGILGIGIRVWAIMLLSQCMKPHSSLLVIFCQMYIPIGCHILSF